jgi:hypothetical protein
MATINNVGKAGTGYLHPYILDPRNFMNRETLEINWDAVHAYIERHQAFWKSVSPEYRDKYLDEIF